MIFTVRQPVIDTKAGGFKLVEIPVEDIKVDKYAVLAIDGSTSNSGLAIVREFDGGILYSMTAKREDKETPVQYKVRLKRVVNQILRNNKLIANVYYEEPVVANITAVKNLFMLRTFVEELIVEEEPTFDYLKHYEVVNTRWKKEFLAPDKLPQGTEKQKEAVRKKLIGYLPFLEGITQDEVDAIGLGWVAAKFQREEAKGGEELKSKKKARPFQYNVQFIGADDDDGMWTTVWDTYDGPEALLSNGVTYVQLGNRDDFDKNVYSKMGDDDKIVLLRFSSKTHGDIILKHRIGNLAAQYDYIYAIVWRKSRK